MTVGIYGGSLATVITPTDIKTRYPEFTDISDATIQMAIDETALTMSECQWKEKYTLGMIHKTAHILVSSYQGAIDGLTSLNNELIEQPTGSVLRSESFELAREWDQIADKYRKYEESSTAYGMRYLRLRSTIFFNRTRCWSC